MTAITLLDGGMGQELVHRSGQPPTDLWSTRVMLDHPGLVREVHEDYFRAGASVATTNTYAIHRDRLARHDLADRYGDLISMALSEAKAARLTHGAGLLAGSIGPLVASYRPETHPPHDEAVALYAEAAHLIGPHVDLILCETVASLAHATAVLEGAKAGGKPVWLSVTVDDEDGRRLRSGETVGDLCALASEAEALLANCSAPEAMAHALGALKACGKPFGAYANGFTGITKEFLQDNSNVEALTARRDMAPETYARFAMRWVDMGATIVGGCCETGPAHIAKLAARLNAAGHEIV